MDKMNPNYDLMICKKCLSQIEVADITFHHEPETLWDYPSTTTIQVWYCPECKENKEHADVIFPFRGNNEKG